jgi:phosphatidylserine/phosphatidylglycerophosphate/cardiolipin synthase-like enzyme
MSESNGTALSRIDTVVGNSIEAMVGAKHAWRLRRLGWAHALSPGDDGIWAAGDPPPREGCSLEVLIDGAEAFAAIAEAIENARDYVHVTGWHVAPYFELVRGEQGRSIGQLLAEAAERVDVRVLVWAGAPVPAFHPTRKEVRDGIEELTRGTRIRCQADPREHPFHCHHEKTLVIDGELAFVNGIDMTDYAGDRFDVHDHPARRRLGWHDVGTRLRGPAVKDVHDHFELRWRELTGERLERPGFPSPAGEHTVQVVRTVSEVMYEAVPRGDFRILESYVRAIRSAERFIYIENQFLWAPEIADLLAEKLSRPPHPDFRLVVLLPSRANNGQDDTMGQLGQLVAADDNAGRLLATTIRSLSGHRDDRLYVHAKVGIVDDRWLTVGSANLNSHSFFNDTEVNVVVHDESLARAARLRLWSEHFERDATGDPREWWDLPGRKLRKLEGVSRRSRALWGPLNGLIVDG